MSTESKDSGEEGPPLTLPQSMDDLFQEIPQDPKF